MMEEQIDKMMTDCLIVYNFSKGMPIYTSKRFVYLSDSKSWYLRLVDKIQTDL